MSYCAQANMERAVGGAAVLVELLDKDGDGIADALLVTELLSRADGEIDAAIQQAGIEPSTLTSPYPNQIVFCAADLCAYLAFTYGTSGQGVPPEITARHQNALRLLDDFALRKRSVNAPSSQTTNMLLQQVERSTDAAPAYTFETSRGFNW